MPGPSNNGKMREPAAMGRAPANGMMETVTALPESRFPHINNRTERQREISIFEELSENPC
jgi:hypothetical protein